VLSLVGTLPVSALNLGLTAAPVGLQAEVEFLASEILRVQGLFAAQAQLALNVPAPTLAAELQVGVSAGALPTISLDMQAEIAIELGFIEAKLAVVGTLVAKLQAGVDAGGLIAWAYSGSTEGFGIQLDGATRFGFGAVDPDTEVQGLVIASESFSAWGNFGLGFNTGRPRQISGPVTSQQNLLLLGQLTGGQLNTGLLEVKVPIDLFLFQLRGLKAQAQASLEVSLGGALPSAGADLGLDLDAAFDAAINAGVDLDGMVRFLQLRVAGLLDIVANINAQLSGGGLSMWAWRGPAKEFGAALRAELVGGMPGAGGPSTPVYGLAVACAVPSAWAAFGGIFRTGA
jgi:hypothetical protein